MNEEYVQVALDKYIEMQKAVIWRTCMESHGIDGWLLFPGAQEDYYDVVAFNSQVEGWNVS